jgi:hypothetical protein
MITNEVALSFRCCGPAPCGIHDPKRPPERLCIGSKCMAWRFAPQKTWTSNGTATGYCGLASKPQ